MVEKEIFNFEKLRVYKETVNFANEICLLTKKFPKSEHFPLVDQLKRAATSVSLNIAEGSGRSKKEFRRFLIVAKSSLYECVPLLELSFLQGYISKQEKENFYNKCIELSKNDFYFNQKFNLLIFMITQN